MKLEMQRLENQLKVQQPSPAISTTSKASKLVDASPAAKPK